MEGKPHYLRYSRKLDLDEFIDFKKGVWSVKEMIDYKYFSMSNRIAIAETMDMGPDFN